ncbi:MAG: hypothetical protein H6965_12955 [Chromatiaceae bacterium]|nr:hypothetical protein [Chromatiaceae bacterium]
MAVFSRNKMHHWRFHRLGGFDQVRIESGADICHLPALDQKLWAALSCPTTGVEFNARTLELLDSDGDGRIRAPELLAAVTWSCAVLKNPDDLLAGSTGLPLAAINDETEEGKRLQKAARRILDNLGKESADTITAEETADTHKIFANTRFNGDGIVPAASAEDPVLVKAIEDLISCVGSALDRSGAEGISQELADQFFAEADAYEAWWAEAEADAASILPLGDATETAAKAFSAVKGKIDDYFTRAALASFDVRAANPLNPTEADYSALAAQEISSGTALVAAFPLARIEPERALPLAAGVNPAWTALLTNFHNQVVVPLFGDVAELTQERWGDLSARFAAYAEWQSRQCGGAVASLGIVRVRELLGDGSRERIAALISEDKELADVADAIESVDRLLHYHQHLATLLNNFVTLHDFYTPGRLAIFQAGTLYLDGRSCELCVKVADVAAHSALAALSSTYLAYCDCKRRGGQERMTIVAAFTGGDADNLMVGRNGLFYDRQGNDWDATISKIIEHPISVRQAFWAPYKRLARMVSEQIEKFAGAREKAVEAGTAQGVADLSAKAEAGKAAPAPFDIAKFAGIFAAIGLAVGAIGTALASVVTGFMGLTWWKMPLALAGLLLFISGPSMLLAYMKLRRRNLGPMLDANGWAVNTLARINIPFGTTLTGIAELPAGAERSMRDPFAEKRRPWRFYLFLILLLAALGALWKEGYLARWWPQLAPPQQQEQAAPADKATAPPLTKKAN